MSDPEIPEHIELNACHEVIVDCSEASGWTGRTIRRPVVPELPMHDLAHGQDWHADDFQNDRIPARGEGTHSSPLQLGECGQCTSRCRLLEASGDRSADGLAVDRRLLANDRVVEGFTNKYA